MNKKKKIKELKSRADALAKKMQDQKARLEFKKSLSKDDPDAASASAKFRVLKRQGKTPQEIKELMTPKQRADFVRSIDYAKDYSRKLINK